MSEKARENFMAYAAKDDLTKLAENAVFTLMATGQEFHGREEIGRLLHNFYHVQFEADAEIKNIIFSGNNVVLEGDIIGKQLLEYAGIPPSDKQIRAPICIVYDLENDIIARARIYFESEALRKS